MFYQQSSFIRKFIELILVFLVLGFLDQTLEWNMLEWLFNPVFFAVLLFSLRYGLHLALLSFAAAFIYHVYDIYQRDGDLFLLFYDSSNYLSLLFLLVTAVISGLYSTSFRERYESQQYVLEETRDENEELKSSLSVLERSQRVMQAKVLDSEYTLSRIYEVGKTLDQPSPELVRNEAVTIIGDLFEAEDLAVYHVDSSKKSLRLRVRKGNTERLPQTIFIDDAASIFSRSLRNKTITLKTVEDEAAAPVLIGPVVYNQDVREVLVIDQLDFAKLTKYEVQILSLVLDWMGNRIERAGEYLRKEEEQKMYPGTNIYYKEAFDELVQMQEKREEKYGVPFSVVAINVSPYREMSVVEAEIILRAYLRELDIMGYDQSNQYFYFLLPGTSTQNASIVEERIYKALETKGGIHIG
ncbi:hypothetical protein [Halobacillus litoralis]|uniref:hypothetical protein n=1 Tax=Halobacillus litoralis TaxID=45668 RepID=UPI001CD7B6F1|nr:hypothetical protein [Halobacillus litoralis]MCA1022178.1 hypothetical protein [Halobacillus litoralis]